jgi:N-acetylglutamate synthase-like GNAT family acetyltransferase
VTVSIRRAEPTDAAAITALVSQAYTPYIARIGREPAPMTRDYDAAVATGHTWVAESARQLVGMLLLAPATDYLLVDTIAVADASRGLGIGAALLAVADQEARRLGLAQVRLYTNAAMTENLAYYPRRGYRETHRGDEDGFARVFFTKSLI